MAIDQTTGAHYAETDMTPDARARYTANNGKTRIELPGHGLFVAHTANVARRLKVQRKRDMVKAIAEIWPEMIKAKTWTRAQLQNLPSYVLATILEQI